MHLTEKPMTRLTLIAAALLLTIFLLSCEQTNSKLDIERTLLNTILRFPQLPKGKGKQSNYYKLVRSVIIGGNGIELQLRSSPDTIADTQKIIIVINKSKDIYAIPLFSNIYHDYWNFQFDSVLHSVKPTNTTFDKELKSCLEQLNLYDTLGTAGKVMSEMFFSLLQCQQVTDSDSLNLNSFTFTNNCALSYENTDSCGKRFKQNWEMMKRSFHPEKYIINYNACWDKENKRVYQLNF